MSARRRSGLLGELLRGGSPTLPAAEPRRFDPLSVPLPMLEASHGCFRHGYTPEDISAVAAKIQAELGGLQLICLWDYCDRWGAGGSSEILLRDGDGRYFPLPELLRDWLWGNDVSPVALRALVRDWPGDWAGDQRGSAGSATGCFWIDGHNASWEYEPEAELG